MRSVEELVSDDDAWPLLEAMIAQSGGRCVALPPEEGGADGLVALQVSTRSILGAVAYHSGGLLIDHGWIRLFGAGHGSLPSIAAANSLHARDDGSPPLLLVGVDVIGGRFAINGGALSGVVGEVSFWAPDTLAWEPLGVGHGAFVRWLIEGGGTSFYESLRWRGWEADVRDVALDQGLMLHPPPCTVEGRDVSSVSKRAVPRAELDGWLEALAVAPDGAVRLAPRDGRNDNVNLD